MKHAVLLTFLTLRTIPTGRRHVVPLVSRQFAAWALHLLDRRRASIDAR